jgi:RNA polymerase sigma-70 factor (ECF subfamily)
VDRDDQLLARIEQRDGEALEQLMARHRQAVVAAAQRIVRDVAAADDIAQEVFLRVWTSSAQYSGQGSVAAWIGRIAVNLSLNYLRSVRRRGGPTPQGETDDESIFPCRWIEDAESLDPRQIAQSHEMSQLLRDLVGRLSDDKRRLVDMVFGGELRLDEAAAAMGIPPGTAKSRLHYAIRTLSRFWRELHLEDD